MPESAEPPPASGEGSRVAAGHATTAVPSAAPDELVGDVRGGLAGNRFESVEDVVVLDGGLVVGILPVERLLEAPASVSVGELMTPDPVTIAPDADEVLAARRLIGRHESSLVVVDRAGQFRGLVPPSRMLPVLLAAHESDLARLGGYLAGTRQARGAAEESVGRRLWHRLPWLLVGLLGAMGAAVLVGAFEERLEANVLIAFFVPAVVYMADAVGTQTETVLIRALAAGVSTRSIFARELVTGLVMGVVVGGVFFAFAAVGWGDEQVALAVAIALLASCSIATLVAMALPAAFHRFGRDPAFGSGPLATVLQDLLSIAVYLAAVVALVD